MDRVRVFIDSNIIISAMVYDRNELEIIERLKLKVHNLVISDHVHEEVFRVMLEKFPEYMALVDEFIKLSAMEIVPSDKYEDTIDQFGMVRDNNDRHILAAAVAGKCDMIITGDKDLLVLKSCRNIHILNSKGAKRYV